MMNRIKHFIGNLYSEKTLYKVAFIKHKIFSFVNRILRKDNTYNSINFVSLIIKPADWWHNHEDADKFVTDNWEYCRNSLYEIAEDLDKTKYFDFSNNFFDKIDSVNSVDSFKELSSFIHENIAKLDDFMNK